MGVDVELLEEYEREENVEGLTMAFPVEDEPHAPRATEKQIGGDHYKDMRIQPTTFIEQNGLGWCEGNAVKYICRHRQKGQIKDIQKAIHYLDLLLEQEYCYVRTENTRS